MPDDNHPGGHLYEHLRGNKYIAKGNSVSLSRYVILLPLLFTLPYCPAPARRAHIRTPLLLPCRTCRIGNNTLIGSHTVISANASVHASVIGQRCTIGPGAVLREAYIFDDTHIGAGAVVEGSIIGARVTLGDGARIPRGCLIADGVAIGANAKLRKFERVSKKREERPSREEDGSDGDDEESDSELEEIEARMCLSFSSCRCVAY